MRRAFAAETLTVADPGGAWTPACDDAFVKPFEKETGVSINHIAREHYPTVEIKANVETKAYTWDVVIATEADVSSLSPQNLLSRSTGAARTWARSCRRRESPAGWAATCTASVIGYRTDKYGQNGPQNWADFWDVKKFPGRRAMHKHPIDTLEAGADGRRRADGQALSDRHGPRLQEARPDQAACRRVVDRRRADDADAAERRGRHASPTWNARAQVGDRSRRRRSRSSGTRASTRSKAGSSPRATPRPSSARSSSSSAPTPSARPSSSSSSPTARPTRRPMTTSRRSAPSSCRPPRRTSS